MEKPLTVVEISDTKVRVAVGYANNDKINLVYMAERPIDGLISHGEIIDLTTLAQILSSMREFKNETTKEKFVVNEATLVLPSLGLNVFQSEKETNVVSPFGVIAQIDIENVISLVQKEAVPSGSEIIDIIPDTFTLEQGRSYINPPIGEHSNQIKVNAKIHCLPTRIVSEYKRVAEAAHIKVRRLCVGSYAIAELGKHIGDIPNSYVLVDMGAEMSSISLIGNNTPFETIAFQSGGNDLVARIVENFRISPDEALGLLKKYGFDERPLSYAPIIAKGNVDGVIKSFDPNALNTIIKTFFAEDYFAQFDVTFENLMKGYPEAVRNLPIVFTGGFSKLIGFESLAKEKFAKSQSIHYLEPASFGARDARFSAIVGAMYSASKYKGSLSDSRVKTGEISRDKEQN
ncbi:MAG: hypothetical protein KBS97_00125 [Firmicutes bacterium]|nr:hypothetical protein [Candidatus Fiminaster equi]